MPVLEARGLRKVFRGADFREAEQREVVAVDDVSFSLEAGEIVALLGGSGSGKTTTLRMLNRLVEPSAGSVHLGARDAASLPPHELRRRIGYAFQRVGLFPHLSVAENVGVTPSLLGWERTRIEARVAELLALVGLPPKTYARRMPSELSGGQAQRVGVARALAAEPELVLLDEPFGALDAATRSTLQRELLALRDRLSFAALVVTHDAVEALTLGDRVGVMDRGKLLQLGPRAELLAAPSSSVVAELLRAPLEAARGLLEGGGARP